jgi:hypothetical protein
MQTHITWVSWVAFFGLGAIIVVCWLLWEWLKTFF